MATRGHLAAVAGSRIHVNAEKRGAEEKGRMFGSIGEGCWQLIALRGSFYEYAVYTHTLEEKAQIYGASGDHDGVA